MSSSATTPPTATTLAQPDATATATGATLISGTVTATPDTTPIKVDAPTHSALIRPLDATCPSGWTCGDIGTTGLAGGQSFSNGTYTVSGAGSLHDVTPDAFHYVWQSLNGDGSLSGRLVSDSNTLNDTRTGLMIRQSTDPSAPYVFIGHWPYQSGIVVQYRATQGGTVQNLAVFVGSLPVYLGIGRVGSAFTFYTSSDGSMWAPINQSTITVTMTGAVLAGMAVASNVSGVDSSGTFDAVSVSNSSLTPVPNTCPNAWSCADIGLVWPGTQAQTGATTYTVSGAGSLHNVTPDAFHYVWQSLSGNGSLSGRLDTLSNTQNDTRAGLMIRQNTDPSAPYVFIGRWPYQGGLVIQYRSVQGGAVSDLGLFSAALPVYLGIGRVGNAFTFYTSSDGSMWAPINQSTITVTMTGTVLAGMAVASNNSGADSVGTYDNVSVSTAALTPVPNTCPTSWNCADIGLVWPGTQAQTGATTYTVSGAGSLHNVTPDAFHYVWQSLNGDGSLSGRLVSESSTQNDTRTGLMIRQSTDPSAPYVFMGHWPYQSGIVVQYRATQGGAVTQAALVPSGLPVYLKLLRSGNTFTACTSSDGVTWSAAGSGVTVAMSGTILAGLAVASNNSGVPSTGTFDNVSAAIAQGAIPWHPHHSVRLSDGLNVSVDLADGHLDLSQADLSIPWTRRQRPKPRPYLG